MSATLNTVKWGNLALAFLMELWLLFALGFWGFHTGTGIVAQIALGVGAPLLTAVVWGIFMAPRAAVKVSRPVHLALYVAIFGVGALALAVAGQPAQALIFAILAAVTKVVALAFERREPSMAA